MLSKSANVFWHENHVLRADREVRQELPAAVTVHQRGEHFDSRDCYLLSRGTKFSLSGMIGCSP